MYPCYMVDYVIKLDVENNLYIFKEKESKIWAKSEFIYKVQNKTLKACVFGGYTSKDIRDFMIKVYHNNKKLLHML